MPHVLTHGSIWALDAQLVARKAGEGKGGPHQGSGSSQASPPLHLQAGSRHHINLRSVQMGLQPRHKLVSLLWNLNQKPQDMPR